MKNKALLIVRVRFSHTFWRIFFSVLEMRHCLCQHKNTLGFGDDRLSPHGSAGGGGGGGVVPAGVAREGVLEHLLW